MHIVNVHQEVVRISARKELVESMPIVNQNCSLQFVHVQVGRPVILSKNAINIRITCVILILVNPIRSVSKLMVLEDMLNATAYQATPKMPTIFVPKTAAIQTKNVQMIKPAGIKLVPILAKVHVVRKPFARLKDTNLHVRAHQVLLEML